MRKYEKIKENILMMQQLNTKRFEKEREIIPGPDHYNPIYSLVENEGFSVNKIYNLFKNFYFQNFYFSNFYYLYLVFNTSEIRKKEFSR